ncbi:MAG: acetate--CoA ligase family protein [Clostridia bacterium]|nr:acetate--CoA ligase family protein [Clostridia bacterium]
MEYQAKALFEQFGVPTMRGIVLDEGETACDAIDKAALRYPVVVKAQVQIGGRGKAGGILFAQNPREAADHAMRLLGSELRGLRVDKLLLVEKAGYEAEWYLSILLDRQSKCPMILFSDRGGVDIEQTAREDPFRIRKLVIDPMTGVQDHMARYLLSSLSISLSHTEALFALLQSLYKAFLAYDFLLLEINPLVLNQEGKLIALDGKVDIDDSALSRLPDVQRYRDEQPEEPFVKEARTFQFLYIPVEAGGCIAVCSNGSGMLMSCIDMISKEGMSVAAALDLGGGATAARICEAMRILFATPGVKAVFINIFGGITRCDEVAGGVRLAMEQGVLGEKLVLIRMEGTNKEQGVAMIKSLAGNVFLVDGLREGITALVDRRAQL